MKGTATKSESIRKHIRDAIDQMIQSAEHAETSAQDLRDLLLVHRQSLVSDSTILAETATLLSHSAQSCVCRRVSLPTRLS